jgi:hypothetical protein
MAYACFTAPLTLNDERAMHKNSHISRSYILVATSLVVGCASNPEWDRLVVPTLAELESAQELEVVSIDPKVEQASDDIGFHGWTVLGRTRVSNPEAKRRLIDALREGARKSNQPTECFWPRHGISATFEGHKLELVICLECNQVVAYRAGKRSGMWPTGDAPQVEMDSILREAGIRLAEKATR